MPVDGDRELEQRIDELSSRVASLEAALAELSGKAAVREKAVAPPPPPPPPKPVASLESRIGGHLLNRVGILAVLVGVAWFLKLAVDRNWIGPSLRVWIGLAAASGLVAGSERFRRQGFPAFAYSLKALGTSIAYLALWAASSLYQLAPPWLVFLAMTGVTIFNAVLARRQDSEVLALYALAGGLATPGLLSIGHSETFLFCYLALLNAGALLLLVRRPWKRLAWAALLGTVVYCIGWSWHDTDPSDLPLTALFIGLFFAAFAVVPWLQQAISPVVFPIVNGATAWLGLMVLFSARPQHLWRPWATLGLALVSLAIAGRARGALARSNLGLAIFFVTMAVPLEFHGATVRLCWLAEALILVVLVRVVGDRMLRVFAASVLVLAFLALAWDWTLGGAHPVAVVANMGFFTNLAAVFVFATVTFLAAPGYVAALSSVAFSVTALVTVSLEIHHYWFCGAGFFQDFCGRYGQLEWRTIAAGWGYSAWWMCLGAGLMAAGFLRRSAFLRWQALAILALSIGRVFLNGVSQQSQLWRVLSFLALGVLLLGISFVYQKDWLRLRG
jgi:uncharacterized membrane protein